MIWRCRDRAFELAERVLVMGVVNVTPDSFSDGGRFLDPVAAIAQARRLLDEGADLIDLGAESTRPGAIPVPANEQVRRLAPVVEALACETRACLSVDTADAEVAARMFELGAQAVNDVSALADPRMAGVVAERGGGLVLMHMQATPRTMQDDPRYGDVAREVGAFLAARLAVAVAAGVATDHVAIDPGIGFGKTLRHNLELLARLDELAALGRPLVVGVSRKRFIGALLDDLPTDQRLEGGLAAAAIAVHHGARIVRTHDVRATARAVRVAAAIAGARRGAGEDPRPGVEARGEGPRARAAPPTPAP